MVYYNYWPRLGKNVGVYNAYHVELLDVAAQLYVDFPSWQTPFVVEWPVVLVVESLTLVDDLVRFLRPWKSMEHSRPKLVASVEGWPLGFLESLKECL